MNANIRNLVLIIVVVIVGVGAYFLLSKPIPETPTPETPPSGGVSSPSGTPTAQEPVSGEVKLPPTLTPDQKQQIEKALKNATLTNTLSLKDCAPNPKIPLVRGGQNLTVVNSGSKEIHFSVAGLIKIIPPSGKLLLEGTLFKEGAGLYGYSCALSESERPGQGFDYRQESLLVL